MRRNKLAIFRTTAALILAINASRSLAIAQTSPTTKPSVPQVGETPNEQASRAQIRAAVWDALHSLRADIEARSIDSNFTVADLIARTNSKSEWNTAIRRRAEQIGGPRWIDADTCQVRMDLEADRVVKALVDIATSHADASPLPAEALTSKLAGWGQQVFTATGVSLRADRALDVRPPPEATAWNAINDDARRIAITTSREAAINRTLDLVRNVAMTESETVGTLLSKHPSAQGKLRDWLAHQPATAVRFSDDLQVSYAISLTGDDLFDHATAELSAAGVTLWNEAKMAEARDAFRSAVGDTAMVGHASAEGGIELVPSRPPPTSMPVATSSNSSASRPAVATPGGVKNPNRNPGAMLIIPTTPPAWVFHPITAEATASPNGSALKTREAAEDNATDELRQKLTDYSLDGKMSVGEAAKISPQIRKAVEGAIRHARVYHVDYFPDGTVGVKMSLDARDFWFKIERN